MTKKHFIYPAALALLLAVVAGRDVLFGGAAVKPRFADIARTVGIAAPAVSRGDAPAGGMARVLRVVDGDTIELDNGYRVRYIGINTPETVDPRRPVQCFGKEASAMNKELVEGKIVRLEKDVRDTDTYGRLLRYVRVGDVFVNLELVREGYAFASPYPPDVKHERDFWNAEAEARTEKRGLWQKCAPKASAS